MHLDGWTPILRERITPATQTLGSVSQTTGTQTPLNVGTKYDSEKPRHDLLDPHAMEQLAKVLTFGAQKYAPHNWRKGIAKSRLIAAALRHLFAYLGGEDNDPETGLPHVAHAMCNMMFLLGLEHRKDLDDRHSSQEGEKA